jgi:hypothetical protein
MEIASAKPLAPAYLPTAGEFFGQAGGSETETSPRREDTYIFLGFGAGDPLEGLYNKAGRPAHQVLRRGALVDIYI